MESISLFRFLLSLAFFILYFIVWTVGLVGSFTIYTRYSKSRGRQEAPLPESPLLPGVSILRPLKGLDPRLEECLESAFRQNYPQFEVILSVADEQDAATKVARTVISRYPNVASRLIIGNKPRSLPDFRRRGNWTESENQ